MINYEVKFYYGRWTDVAYTSKWLKSPLGHDYVSYIHDHVAPVYLSRWSNDHLVAGHIHRKSYAGDGCEHCDELFFVFAKEFYAS